MNLSLNRRARWWIHRFLARFSSEPLDARQIEGIPGLVHARDTMFDPSDSNGIAYYLRAGHSALVVLEETLKSGDRSPESITSVLDFGCGYGRVLRHLEGLLPQAHRVACDLDAEAVAFCQRAFAAQGVIAPADPRCLELPPCDLIWGGSVWTHLPEAECRQLFLALTEALLPGGLLTFSFHGAFAYGNLHSLFGGAYAEEAATIQAEIASRGFSYRAYHQPYLSLDEGNYGTAWHTPDFFRSLAEESNLPLIECRYQPEGWDSFHDVIAFQRTE